VRGLLLRTASALALSSILAACTATAEGPPADLSASTSTSELGSTRLTTSAPPAPTTSVADAGGTGPTGEALATTLVDDLEVANPDSTLPDYVRARFGDGWDYDPASGCNTRERVLIEESSVPPRVDDRCRSSAGRWVSLYDGMVTDDPADLEIDHMVPLADAWRSGAHRWDDERRRSFANHLTDPEELIAVSSTANRSKSDSSPDRWLPPDREAWCPYVSAWVRVKARWELTVTPAEKATLVRVLEGC
jgi:hypothetical protein